VVVGPDVLSQLRRGVLEYCVLALLDGQELYGFDLVKRLGSMDGMVTGEGTLYPLLSRLQRDGRLSSSWRESSSGGPPRKYYAITTRGRQALAEFTQEWSRFSHTVDTILKPSRGEKP
jgi:PadR family transcriptional regulator, regulatory protein PadR